MSEHPDPVLVEAMARLEAEAGTARDAAAALGIPKSTWSNYRRGQATASDARWALIVGAARAAEAILGAARAAEAAREPLGPKAPPPAEGAEDSYVVRGQALLDAAKSVGRQLSGTTTVWHATNDRAAAPRRRTRRPSRWRR